MHHRLGCMLTSVLFLALGAAPASAQGAYPNKTIRVLIPYAPGGLTDVVARYYGEYLRKTLGQTVLVENKPGASGIIAIEERARAKPDGYTIMVGNISTNCLTPVLLAKRMRIDYDKDVQIIARLADTPVFFMATTVNFPPKTFAEPAQEAAVGAMKAVGMTPDDIDAIVFSLAPTFFMGVADADKWSVDYIFGAGKPMLRVHTGGATGGSAVHAA